MRTRLTLAALAVMSCTPLAGCLFTSNECSGQSTSPSSTIASGRYLSVGDAFASKGEKELIVDRAKGEMTISYSRGGKKVVERWRIDTPR